jgi:hypothetical protein
MKWPHLRVIDIQDFLNRGRCKHHETNDRVGAITSVLNRELQHTQRYSQISGLALGEVPRIAHKVGEGKDYDVILLNATHC